MTFSNVQEPKPKSTRKDGVLDVHSIFETIQGEGPLSGAPSVFVRLRNCNLQCPLCDTEYSKAWKQFEPLALVSEVIWKPQQTIRHRSFQHLIVLTGGEPLRQHVAPFLVEAVREGFHIQIETNGTYDLQLSPRTAENVTVVCSPKTKTIHPDLNVDYFKYVVRAGQVSDVDGLPTSVLGYDWFPARPPDDFPRNKIFVSPCDEGEENPNHYPYIRLRQQANIKTAVDVCLKYGYRLSLQTHKLLRLP